ncbi:MAG: hypothetical protein N2746_05920 [Deltaproteobacteria bacterium]|nr:hypothetical protein [Deltaproteobacteria bacterium]
MKNLKITLSLILLLYSCDYRTYTSPYFDNTDFQDYAHDATIEDFNLFDNQELDTTPSSDAENRNKCQDTEACNNFVNETNSCDGDCIYQEHNLKCEGNIYNNLCYLIDIPEKPIQQDVIDGIKIVSSNIPLYTKEGDSLDIKLNLTNLSESPREIKYSYKNPENWYISPQNFGKEGILNFDPLETKVLRFDALAIKANIFNIYYSPIISLYFNDHIYEIHSWVLFASKDDYIKCNDSYFPPNYCMNPNCSGYALYNYAVCCENVFYPGSMCCSDEDCIEGSCIDGKCISQVPSIALANTTLLQNNRILVILSDFEEFKEEDLCKNKYSEAGLVIGTKKIEEYFKTIIYKRTKRDNILSFNWEILAGLKSEKFITDNRYDFYSFKDGIQRYLINMGCGINFDEYDKIIIISPRLDLYGFGGMAFGLGYIGQTTYHNHYITIHELAHTFGASDLYLDIGGSFQYSKSLMASNLGAYEIPDDKVMWGETGLGDVNNNGVIDLFEFAKFPEEIGIKDLKASITYKDTVEISFKPFLIEDKIPKKGIFYTYYIELPEYNTIKEVYFNQTVTTFDKYEVDLQKIRDTKKLKIRLKTNYRYSDMGFKNKILTFDEVFEVEVDEIKE